MPFALWVDEAGTIVRPAEVAFLPPDPDADQRAQEAALAQVLERLPAERRAVVEAMTRSTQSIDRGRYLDALRDWVANGERSPFALAPDAVIARSRPRPAGAALAAAHFELAQHLHRGGAKLDAVPHFEAAHRLDPENWSYPRQAFSLIDESMGNPYGSDLLAEVARVGVDTFYPPLDI